MDDPGFFSISAAAISALVSATRSCRSSAASATNFLACMPSSIVVLTALRAIGWKILVTKGADTRPIKYGIAKRGNISHIHFYSCGLEFPSLRPGQRAVTHVTRGRRNVEVIAEDRKSVV